MNDNKLCKLVVVETHPIQYKAPLFRLLTERPEIDLTVLYAMLPDAAAQGAGFGVAFEWDVPLLKGYRYEVLENRAQVPSVTTFSGCDTPGIYDWLKRARPDVVMVNGWVTKTCLQALWACRRLRIPCMVRGEANLLRPRAWWKHLGHRLLLKQYAAYLPIGSANSSFYRFHGCPDTRLFPVPYCVDNEKFSVAATDRTEQRAALRKFFGLPVNAVVFLFCGKLIPKKRPMDAIRALQKLSAFQPPCPEGSRGSISPFLFMVGDGPLMEECKRAIATGKLPAVCAGFLNQGQIADAYAAADVFVLPSDAGETWGLVVNEAMAAGHPAIVSRAVGCCEDLIVEGETGYAFDLGDVDALAGHMKRFVDEPNLAREQGEKAAQHIEKFSLEVAVEGIVEAVGETTEDAEDAEKGRG